MRIASRPRFAVAATAALFTIPLWLGGCSPGSDITSAESDVVVTLFDPGVDFGAIRTYAMPDTIVHFCTDNDCPGISRDQDAEIIALVHERIEERGYMLEPDPDNNTPDSVFFLGVTQSDFYSFVGGPCWGWRPPGWGWYPGWCWGYPPVMRPVYSFSTGTLFIMMEDPKNPDLDLELAPVIWNASLNGVLNDTSAGLDARVRAGIDQAFAQSPYLRRAGS